MGCLSGADMDSENIIEIIFFSVKIPLKENRRRRNSTEPCRTSSGLRRRGPYAGAPSPAPTSSRRERVLGLIAANPADWVGPTGIRERYAGQNPCGNTQN